MKAKIKNGNITKFETLPATYISDISGNLFMGFDLADKSVHESEGFFDLITPQFDNLTQQLGEIYFDQDNHFFTFNVVPLLIPLSKPIVSCSLTYLEFFLGRFTEDELEAIEEACEPIIPENRRLRMAMKFMEKASYIDPSDPRTGQFVQGLVDAGLVTQERATSILQ